MACPPGFFSNTWLIPMIFSLTAHFPWHFPHGIFPIIHFMWHIPPLNNSEITIFFRQLDRVWRKKTLSTPTKICIHSTCLLPALLCGFETWTLLAEDSRQVQAFHMTCQHRILGIQWHDFVASVDVQHQTKLSNVLEMVARRSRLPIQCWQSQRYTARKWQEALRRSTSPLVDLTAGGEPGEYLHCGRNGGCNFLLIW